MPHRHTKEQTMHDILVHANNFTTWSHGVEYAAKLAAAQSAALTAVYVYPSPLHMMPAYGAEALLATIVEQSRRIEKESLAAESDFTTWAKALGVKQASWVVAEGFVPEALAHIGNWHDLLVLERNDESPWESVADLGSLVVRAGLPCLVVPPGASDPGTFDCIALAWNGSQEALRAIHAARPLLARAKRIVLLTGRRRDPLSEIGWRPAFDILSYLSRHGITPEQREISADETDAGAALLAAAAALHADLLVMGAYGRNRFSEWIFGGATRHVLGHANIPVFMRH
jgi:nucleotide-binding universal stress UspA family protein